MESKIFTGRIAVGDDSPLEVELRVTLDQLQVAAGAVDIGTWPIADCTIRASESGDFALDVDGDAILFTPDDAGDFAELVASVDQGNLKGFLSGKTGFEGSEVEPHRPPLEPTLDRQQNPELGERAAGLPASQPGPKKRRADKPKQTPASNAEADVAESGLADSEATSLPPPVAIEGSQVEEVADRAPKHKKPRQAPKGTPRVLKRVVVDDVDQVDRVVVVEPGPSSAAGVEIEAGPEPTAAEPLVSDHSLAPDQAVTDAVEMVGGDWNIDPGPEPEPWSPQPEEPVVEVPAVEEAGPTPDGWLVADDPGSNEAVLDRSDEALPDQAGEDLLDPDDEPGTGEPTGTPADGSDVAAEEEPAQTAEALASSESLTERVMAIGGEGEELRRNFGQRLGRRRIAPTPSAAESLEDGGAAPEITLEAPSPDAVVGADAASLAAAVEALRRQADDADEAVTVADAIIASQRSLRESSTKPSRLPGFLRRLVILTGVVLLLGGLGLGGYLAFRLLTEGAESTGTTSAQPTPTVDGSQVTPSTSPVATTAPPTTEAAPETTVAALQPTAFALTAPEFVKRWNETAASINPQLALPSLLPGDFEFQLTPFVAVAGTVGAAGSVDTVTMTIDPTGPSEADAVGLQAMGLLIAVADPNVDGPGRRDLLASMGLDVSKPVLIGLDSVTARGGVAYRLFYDDAAQRLFFTAAAG